jgi:hypothetical protein
VGEGVLLLTQNEALSELMDLVLVVKLVGVTHEVTFVVEELNFAPRSRALVDSLTNLSFVMVSEDSIHDGTGLGAS